MSTLRQSKRKRVDSPHTGAPSKSKYVYIDDGNIILEADLVQFRVHRSMLSAQSTVFADMFTLPQPQENVTIDDCPIVHLSDSAEDVEYLLRAIYDGSWYYGKELPRITVIASLLRMSRKYDCKHLYKNALSRLVAEYPTTLANWDACQDKYTRINGDSALDFDVVNIAREHSINTIRSAAYLACLEHFTPEDILYGTKRDDGSYVTLSLDDLRVCALGWHKFVEAQAEFTFEWLSELPEPDTLTNCSQKMICHLLRLIVAKQLTNPSPEPRYGLMTWSDLDKEQGLSVGLCRPCLEAAKESHAAGRERMWESLPTFFNLGDWEDLHNE